MSAYCGCVRTALLDLCKVSAAAKSEANARPNCWRCLNFLIERATRHANAGYFFCKLLETRKLEKYIFVNLESAATARERIQSGDAYDW